MKKLKDRIRIDETDVLTVARKLRELHIHQDEIVDWIEDFEGRYKDINATIAGELCRLFNELNKIPKYKIPKSEEPEKKCENCNFFKKLNCQTDFEECLTSNPPYKYYEAK